MQNLSKFDERKELKSNAYMGYSRSVSNKGSEVYSMTKLGKIKWFNNEKGYGFIEGENEEDIFVHYTAIKQDGYKSLSEGQIVEYELLETEKGLQAINVKEVSNATVHE